MPVNGSGWNWRWRSVDQTIGREIVRDRDVPEQEDNQDKEGQELSSRSHVKEKVYLLDNAILLPEFTIIVAKN